MALDPEPVPVAELVAETVAEAEVAPASPGAAVGFAVDVQPAAAGRVRPTADRLHQVLVNLLDNAARHGPPGGVVRAVARARRGDGWSIEVRDEGPGIAPEDRDRVFHRFTRGERAVGGRHRAGAGHRPLGGGPARRRRSPSLDPPDGRGCRIRVTLPGAA